VRTLNQTTYNTITATVFLIVALLHLLRIIFGWSAQIGDLNIPLWVSWLGLIVSATLAYFGFRQNTLSGRIAG
jgi:hypothetical protein